jgi:hypothetical protein
MFTTCGNTLDHSLLWDKCYTHTSLPIAPDQPSICIINLPAHRFSKLALLHLSSHYFSRLVKRSRPASGSSIEAVTDSADDSAGCSAAEGERRLTPAASSLPSVVLAVFGGAGGIVLAVFGGAGGRGAVGGGPGLKVWPPYWGLVTSDAVVRGSGTWVCGGGGGGGGGGCGWGAWDAWVGGT